MHKVTVNGNIYTAPDGSLLSDLLMHNNLGVEHPCSGKGLCKKCKVTVNGRETLSCQYRIFSDITVEFTEGGAILSECGTADCSSDGPVKNLVLDIGTTTLAVAAVTESGKTVLTLTENNPQRAFGADIISRINYCKNNGVNELKRAVTDKCNEMIMNIGAKEADTLFVTGNVTMLHIFSGTDCSSLGSFPYTPAFLEEKEFAAARLGISNVKKVRLLPSVNTFTGADIVSGMNLTGFPPDGRYYLLIDLGTNAEIVLYSRHKALSTAAAAGPCFEGAGISCGMSAVNGAVYEYSDGAYRTVGDCEAKGICGTGLIDTVAYLLEKGYIDESGYMPSGSFRITDTVYITAEDIRQYQLAKSAIYSAAVTLIRHMGITFADIERLYISGGFSSRINPVNAVKTGLFPLELIHKCCPLKNSALLGAIKYAVSGNDLNEFIKITEYKDLSSDRTFSELFMENMAFEAEEI